MKTLKQCPFLKKKSQKDFKCQMSLCHGQGSPKGSFPNCVSNIKQI